MEKRNENAKAIKIVFHNEVPNVVLVHRDGKLLPVLDPLKSREERLLTENSDENKELISVPRLDNSSRYYGYVKIK